MSCRLLWSSILWLHGLPLLRRLRDRRSTVPVVYASLRIGCIRRKEIVHELCSRRDSRNCRMPLRNPVVVTCCKLEAMPHVHS